jgi:type II secretory pathway component GspD/PulD (secretin)
MSRFWIGLAMLLWLNVHAVGGDEPRRVLPPAVNVSDDGETKAAPTERKSSATSSERARFGQPMAPQRSSVAPERNREQRHTQLFRLRFASANQLAHTITTLLKAKQRAGHVNDMVVVAEPASNSLAVSGSSEGMKEVRELVAALDCQPPADSEQQRSIEVLQPRNLPAAQLAQTITAVLGATRGSGQTATVVPDSVSNSLVVCAAKQQMH